MNAAFDWLLPAPPKYCVGRMGPSEGPPGVWTDCPITGVHGKPVCQVTIGQRPHPPRTFPRILLFCRKGAGISQTAAAGVWGRTSESEGPQFSRLSWCHVWFVIKPGP